MKYVKRIIGIIFLLLIVLLASVFILLAVYKKELAGVLIGNLKINYGLTLKVQDVDVSLFNNFPQASVKLKGVFLNSDLHPDKKPLLTAKSIALSINLQKLLKKEFEVNAISVNDASVNLVKNSDGSKNFEFTNQNSTQTVKANALTFNIRKIALSNTTFSFSNKEKGQVIDLTFVDNTIGLKKHPEGFKIDLNGTLNVAGLLFNPAKGAFLKNTVAEVNINAIWFTHSKSVFVHVPSTITIDKTDYEANAFIQLGEEKKLALKINAKAISYQKTARLLNTKIQHTLSNFTVTKPFDASVLVIAALGVKQDPIILVNVKSRDNDITIGNSKIPYSNVSFNGTILSLDSSFTKGNEEKARVIFSPVKGNVYDVPFTAAIRVTNFTDPFINISASLFIDAAKAQLLASDEFDLKGTCVANVSYSGSTHKLNKEEFLNEDMKLNAVLVFKNFSYKEHHKPYVYTVNGKTRLTNTELKFNQLKLKTDGGDVALDGKVNYFAQYVLGLTNDLKINLTATTGRFILDPFLKKSNKPITAQSARASKKAVKQLNKESNFEFSVLLKAQKMLVRKVIAENAVIDLFYKNSLLNIRSLSVNTCDGKLTAKATVDKLETIKAELNLDNINVTELFEQFENFGQQAIQSKQLKGKISVNAKFDTKLDENMQIIPSTMGGIVKLKLKEGHLLNYEPLQNISNFVFHNRDFNDVTFSEMHETFRINGYEMDIEELEIASNILNLFVQGTYNFKSLSNINLVIPWSNLKRRGKNYIPKSSGQSAEDTKGLKLNYSGMPKKMKLNLGHK